MQSAAGPPGGSNPKRATGRSHRSADGASPAALDRSPREVARPAAHAHGLASTATFGGAICAFIALWILLAPIELLPTVGGAHSVHFESDSLFGRHALRQKVAAGCPRRASQLPARTAASSSRPASTSVQSTFCRCVLVVSCGGGQSLPRRAPGDSKVSVRPVRQARLQRGTTIVLRCCSLTFPTVHSRQSTTTARHRVTASSFCTRSRGSRAGTLRPSAARVRRALLRTPATVPSPHTFWLA